MFRAPESIQSARFIVSVRLSDLPKVKQSMAGPVLEARSLDVSLMLRVLSP